MGLTDSQTHTYSVSAKNKVAIPAVNISGASPQSAEYIRPTDSVERPTTHSVPSSSGRSGSTRSGGAAHHKFLCMLLPPNSLLLCTPIAIYMVYFPKKFGFSPFYTYLCPSYHINDVANGNLSRLATVKFCIDRCPIGVWQILPMCSQHGFLSVLNNCPPSSFFISSSERLFDYL